MANPKGGNQALSIRIRNDAFSTFPIELEVISGVANPKGGKSSALYQNPGSIHFNVFLTSNEKFRFAKIICFQLN